MAWRRNTVKLKNIFYLSLNLVITSLTIVPVATAQVPCGPTISPPATLSVSWPQYHFDAALTSCNPYESILGAGNVKNLTLDWQLPSVQGAPAIAGGAVFMSARDGTMYALNANTGATLWSYQPDIGGTWGEAAVGANGVVYAGFDDGPWGMVGGIYALDPRTGFPLWRYPLGAAISPTVANGTLYFGEANYVFALDAATGVLKWTTLVGDEVIGQPAVANGRVYIGTYSTNSIYALDAVTGSLLWSYATTGLITSTPTVAEGVLYVGSGDNKLYALDAATGAFRWAYLTGGAVGSPAIGTGVVYFGSEDLNLYAANASTGNLIWKYQIGQAPSLAVANGVLYAANVDDLWAFNAKTGALLLFYAADLQQASSAVVNGKVYVGTDSSLWVFHLPGH
jgi:outer membrane protein assembly factor BamB